jgi:hypothetical protein
MEPTSLGLRPGPNDIGALQPGCKKNYVVLAPLALGATRTRRYPGPGMQSAPHARILSRGESHARAAAQWCCSMFSLCSASSWRPSSPP